MPSTDAAFGLTAYSVAAEAGVTQVPHDGVADLARRAARTDHRDRSRREQPCDRRGFRVVLALGDRPEGIGRRNDREAGLDGAGFEVHLAHPPGRSEHLQHRGIARQRLRGERVDPVGARDDCEMLEQQRADAAPLVLVGHHERDLGNTGAHGVVTRRRDDLTPEEHDTRRMTRLAEMVHLDGGGHRRRHRREEPQIDRVVAEPLVHAGDQRRVVGAHRPHAHGRAVGEDDITLPVVPVPIEWRRRPVGHGSTMNVVNTSVLLVARFEDDHGRLGSTACRHTRRGSHRPRSSVATADHAHPRGRTRAHRARRPALQANDGIRVRLEIEPPRGMALVPPVHREHDEIRAVFEVAEDDAAFLPGLPPDGCEAKRAPTALARRGPQEAPATDPVERSVDVPERVLEPRRRELCGRVAVAFIADTSRGGARSEPRRTYRPVTVRR